MSTLKKKSNAAELFLDFDPVFPEWPENGYPDVVTMHSTVRIIEPAQRREEIYTQVYPAEADPAGPAPVGRAAVQRVSRVSNQPK